MDPSTILRNATSGTGKLNLKLRVDLDLDRLKKLPPKLRRAVIIGCNRAAKPVRAAIESNAAAIARYGFYSRSIGTKTRLKKTSVLTVIGPKMSFTRVKGKYRRGPSKGLNRKHVPWLYARVVERGSLRSRARPVLQPAFDSTAQQYLEDCRREVAGEMAKVTS